MGIAFLMMHITTLHSVVLWVGPTPSNTPCPKLLNQYQQTPESRLRYVLFKLEVQYLNINPVGGKVIFHADNTSCE